MAPAISSLANPYPRRKTHANSQNTVGGTAITAASDKTASAKADWRSSSCRTVRKSRFVSAVILKARSR